MARLKAASLINTIDVVRELVEKSQLEAILETLPPPTQALFLRRMLAVEWIEADEWLPFQAAMLERYFAGDEAAFRAFVRKLCERDFSTFYKLVIRLLISPESLLERTAKLWSTYTDEGDLDITARERDGERQRVVLRLSGFRSQYPVFGVLVHGFLEQLLKMSGAHAVEVTRPLNQLVAGALETELIATFR